MLVSSSGRQVAMKFATQGYESSLLDEERIFRHLGLNDNIVQFFGSGTLKNNSFLMMEFMERGSLRCYLNSSTLTQHQVLKLATDISKGVAFLKKNGVLHKDLSHNNVLIDNTPTAKICDFGSSQLESEPWDHYIGTYWWMAPELFNGYIHTNSDVYSMGILIWEIQTGSTSPAPPVGKDIKEWRREGGKPDIPVGGILSGLIEKCLSYYPDQRPSAQLCVEELTKMLPWR